MYGLQNTLAFMTKLVKNGELGKFINRGVYPAPQHEGFTELQRKAESTSAYPLLDRVHASLAFHLHSWPTAHTFTPPTLILPRTQSGAVSSRNL